MTSTEPRPASVLERGDLDRLIDALRDRGYRVVGPRRRDGAIVYDEVASAAELPAGWTDRQDAGSYRLEERSDAALFGYHSGSTSWKRFLFPPELRLWRARRAGRGFVVEPEEEPAPAYALLGVRACELAAIAIQDRVFAGNGHQDPHYLARRSRAFLVAVACGESASTCFCASMGTGPAPGPGYDLSLTELVGPHGGHRFVVLAGSERGAELLAELPVRPATEEELATARALPERAAAAQKRRLETKGLPELLAARAEHPHWEEVAKRCLACGNCTLSCPTCFCHTVEESSDLGNQETERLRRWDSCFSPEFSYIHGGSVRTSVRSRYRQWLTHKLSSWQSQFGTSGCVGCGRCITWCPAGIDLTVEVRALAAAGREEVRRANA